MKESLRQLIVRSAASCTLSNTPWSAATLLRKRCGFASSAPYPIKAFYPICRARKSHRSAKSTADAKSYHPYGTCCEIVTIPAADSPFFNHSERLFQRHVTISNNSNKQSERRLHVSPQITKASHHRVRRCHQIAPEQSAQPTTGGWRWRMTFLISRPIMDALLL